MNYALFAIIAVGMVWVGTIFFGYITGTGKAFQKRPASVSAQASRIKSQQQEFTDDTASKQQAAMEKLRDRVSNSRD